jgi:hypothetical protein
MDNTNHTEPTRELTEDELELVVGGDSVLGAIAMIGVIKGAVGGAGGPWLKCLGPSLVVP